MKSFKIFGLLLLFLFLVLSLDVYAVSMSPELKEKLKEEGRLEEVLRQLNLARQKGVDQPNPNPPLKRVGKTTQIDTVKAVVLLVDFDDRVATHSPGEFDTLLFSKGFVYPTGSMRDFYWENSYQTFEVIGDAYGWYRMPWTNVAYACSAGCCYGTGGDCPYPYNAQRLVEDAIDAADPYVNFADYDHDGNGWVDALFVVHAGRGGEQTGNCCDIWSHKWVTSHTVIKDGVYMSTYAMEPEKRTSGLVDMGVFSHEFGHVLGLPDLYDTDGSSEGLGNWTLMAGGSWNNGGRTPAHLDGWCKKALGFSDVQRLTANQTDVEILQTVTSPVSYRLWTGGSLTTEYFLVENRQKVGFDQYIPGHGLLIYHVHESVASNSGEWCPGDPAYPHYKVALEQADGRFGLEGCYGSPNRGDGGDPFPGSYNKRAFDDTTTLSSRNYNDDPTEVAVWNISDSDSAMYANMDVNWSRPALFLDEFVLDDTVYGNGNGLPEPGETIILYFTISNIWASLLNTTVTGLADNPGITFTDDQSYVGTIPEGGSVNNYSDPIEFEVSPVFENAVVTFTLHVEGEFSGEPYSADLSEEAWVGRPDILIVDDDLGTSKYDDYQSNYTDALDSLKSLYNVWDKALGDTTYDFSDYKILIWYTGDHRDSVFSSADIESLMSFLDNGGRLFLTSQDAAEALSSSGDPLDSTFLTDYLHCALDNGSAMERQVMGVSGDTIGDGWYMYLWGIPSPQNQTSRDALAPDDSADTVLNYAGSGWSRTDLVAGLRYQGDYKLVFFGFGFEGMNTANEFQGQPLARPHVVMQRVLDWLAAPWLYVNGDANGDGMVDIADVVYLINYLFLEGFPPNPMAAGDANGDCLVDIADVVYLLNYLFMEGDPPQEGCA